MTQNNFLGLVIYIMLFFVSLLILHFHSHRVPRFLRPSNTPEKIAFSVLMMFSMPLLFMFSLFYILLVLGFYNSLSTMLGAENFVIVFTYVVGAIALAFSFAVNAKPYIKMRVAALAFFSGIACLSLDAIVKALKSGSDPAGPFNQFFVFSLAIATMVFTLIVILFSAQWLWSKWQSYALNHG